MKQNQAELLVCWQRLLPTSNSSVNFSSSDFAFVKVWVVGMSLEYSQTLFIRAVWDQGVPITSKLPVSLDMQFITSLTMHKFYLAGYNKVQIPYTFL